MSYLILILVFFLSNSGYSQILVDETWGSNTRYSTKSLSEGALKSNKRIGIQGTLAGAAGLAGLNLDMNLTKSFAFSLGLGVSRGFQSYNMHIKRSLGEGDFIPYFVAGYSRWYSGEGAGEVKRTSPPILANKFLSGRERATGVFTKDIIYPGFGLQYLLSEGDLQGLGFFAEALMLVDVNDFLAGGTGGIGTIFYF